MSEMFSTISPRYDFITRAFSYGMDRSWKRQGVRHAGLRANALTLDLAAGTGDFTRIVEHEIQGARSLALDLTLPMLALARRDGVERAVCGDAMRLPFPDDSFDAVFVGYGLRNFPKLDVALQEIRRVLRPGACLVSLDFFLPANWLWRRLYLGYLYANGAFWGLVLHRRPRIYTYIPDSIRSFVTIDQHSRMLEHTGYHPPKTRRFLLGGIGLHWAVKP